MENREMSSDRVELTLSKQALSSSLQIVWESSLIRLAT